MKRLIVAIAVAILATGNSYAIEYIDANSPTADSAKTLNGPIAYAFKARPQLMRKGIMDWKERLDTRRSSFWRDATFNFNMRTMDFDRRNSSVSTAEAWAVGGKLAFESGSWRNFKLKTVYYNSSKLTASGGDTGLLAPGQEQISIIAEANLSYEFDSTPLKGSVVRLGRQPMDIPYINTSDIRMLPSTHEAYTISRRDSRLDYMVGHITKLKRWDSDEFVYMSEAAGAGGTDKGITALGMKLPISNEKLTFGVGALYGWDTYNTIFTEGSYYTEFNERLDMRLSIQYTGQRSVGDELAGDFKTHHAAWRAAFGWRGMVLNIAGSITSDDAGISKPWGGSPSYLALMRGDFDRANERGLLAGLSFKTERLSHHGLSGYINVATGTDAEGPATGAPLPDRTEYDVTVDWKPPRLPLKGLWIRVRYAHVDNEGDGETVSDIRLILNYIIPFF